MTNELSILALFGLLTIVIILIHVLAAMAQVGAGYLFTPRDEARVLTGFAGRSERCLNNTVLSMALFAPAVLILAVLDAFSGPTLLAAQAFLAARLVYMISYYGGIKYLRTGVWMLGLLSTLYMYWAAFNAAS